MKSRNTYSHSLNRRNFAPQNCGGFTLIEILIVIGMFAIIAGIGMVFSMDAYRSYLFRAEYGNFSHVLAKARNYAVNNYDESAHGVHIGPDSYTLFAGSSYDPTDPNNQDFQQNDIVNITGATEIVFEQLSGDLSSCDATPCEIQFDYGVNNETITISDIGGITW